MKLLNKLKRWWNRPTLCECVPGSHGPDDRGCRVHGCFCTIDPMYGVDDHGCPQHGPSW